VAPGTCYELLQQRTRLLPRGESAFVEISRILLSSTLISALALFLLALVHAVAPAALVDPPQLLIGGMKYVVAHPTLTGRTALSELALATLLAVVFNDLRTSNQARPIVQSNAWHALGEILPKPGQEVNLSVRLKSGAELNGYYVGASTELESAKRELILAGPLTLLPKDGEPTLEFNPAWQRLAVNGAEIAYVTAQHIGEGQEPASGDPCSCTT
jgi:hypothetical protein